MSEPPSEAVIRRRRRRRRRHLKRLIRRFRPILAGLVLVVAAAAAVVAASSWQHARAAERTLTALRIQLDAVVANSQSLQTASGRAADIAQLVRANTTAADLSRSVHDAVALRIVRWIPVVGRQRDGMIQLVDDVHDSLGVGQRLLEQANQLAATAKVTGGTLPVAAFSQLAPDIGRAGRDTSRMVRPASSLWGPLGSSRRKLNALLTKESAHLTSMATTLDGARQFLGAGDHHYLLALENNAEMRDQGMVLSYAEMDVSNGTIQFGRHGSVDNIELAQPIPTPVPPGTAAVFGFLHPTQTWQSVNAGADFAWSAQAMSEMYRQQTGHATDGVIALDVPALAALLQVTGPVQVPGIAVPLSGSNANTVLLHDIYAAFGPTLSQELARHEQLDQVAGAVIAQIRQGSFDPVALAVAVGEQAAGAHIKVWTRNAEVERDFEQIGVAGGPAVIDPASTFHLAVEDRGSNKLDYYVHVTMRQEVTITATGDAIVKSTVEVRNDAPVGSAPSAQLGPDLYRTTTTAGDYLGWVLLWAPRGSQPVGVAEAGLNLNQANVLVPAGQSRTTQFVTVIYHAIRKGRLTLRYVPQPRLAPQSLAVSVHGPGFGGQQWSGPLDKTRVFAWQTG